MSTNNTTDSPEASQPAPKSWLAQLRPQGLIDWTNVILIAGSALLVAIRPMPDRLMNGTLLFCFVVMYLDQHLQLLRSPRAYRFYAILAKPLILSAKILIVPAVLVIGHYILFDGALVKDGMFFGVLLLIVSVYVFTYSNQSSKPSKPTDEDAPSG